MVVTLTGENSFGLQQELDKFTKLFLKDNDELALQRLDGEEAGISKINEAINSPPFLASKKMVILRAPGKNKQFLEIFEQLLSGLPETTEVIIVEPKLDKRMGYYKFLQKNTDFREFPELNQDGLASWLVNTAKARKGSLSLADARYLVERAGENQQLLSNELEKLLLYDQDISRQSIDLLIEPAPRSTIFQLLEAAFSGDTKKTLQLYEEQRALKVETQQIIAMLAWQLHVLAVIKTAGDRTTDQIAKQAKINPFVVRKSQAIAKKLPLKELKGLIADLLDIDIKTKSVNIDADEALRQYLFNLAES